MLVQALQHLCTESTQSSNAWAEEVLMRRTCVHIVCTNEGSFSSFVALVCVTDFFESFHRSQ